MVTCAVLLLKFEFSLTCDRGLSYMLWFVPLVFLTLPSKLLFQGHCRVASQLLHPISEAGPQL